MAQVNEVETVDDQADAKLADAIAAASTKHDVSSERLAYLVERVNSLMQREPGKTFRDACPQVLNGAGYNGRSERDQAKRKRISDALGDVFKQLEKQEA